MNNLGVEIGGNFVSFAELRSDVQACYRKGMGSNFCFLPETVEALLDYIAAQQSVQPTNGGRCEICNTPMNEHRKIITHGFKPAISG